MSSISKRTWSLALLIPLAAGCSSAPPAPVPGAAPYEAELARGALSITAASVHERLGVIADDSMGGRNTPSIGLEKTAAYFADKYKAWGLVPAGENGTYFQRYPITKHAPNQTASWLEADENGTISRYVMGDWGYATRAGDAGGELVIFAGQLTTEAINAVDLTGKIAMLVYDTARVRDWAGWSRTINARNPAGVVLLRNDAPETFRAMATQASGNPRFTLGADAPAGPPVVVLHDNVFRNDPSAANRPDFAQMRRAPSAIVQVVPSTVRLRLHVEDAVLQQATAPNVVAMIPGSDPALRDEYVVFSGHMDHIGTIGDGIGGCRAAPAQAGMPVDSICNGADDDGSGSTGVLMVAEAFSRLKVKPRRSILILHVSGEEKGLWGSQWFSEHPTVPLDKIVADINMDMIGRNAHDSIVVIGKEHSDMGTTLARVNARHPELGLVTADDIWPNERFYFRSDHFNFARKGVPILFFFNGTHPQYHRSDDELQLIDTDKLARVAKTAFYLGAEIANTAQKPVWNPESYKEIVGSSR